MSKVTAIIPSLVDVDKGYLKLCVESLRESGFDGDITVVMNGTKDMNPLIDFPIEGITKAIVTKQQGQCNAVNQGAKMVEGDCKYLFVVNSDMYFAPGWDNNLDIDNLPSKCCSPNLVEPENNMGSAAPFLKFNGGFSLEEFNQDMVDKNIKSNIHDLQDARDLAEPGFNLPFFIDIELWRTIGGYDTKYDPWGSNSDTDLQTLINLAGVIPMRLRDVLVYHFSNKSGTFDGSHQDEWQRNFDYYRTKFGYTRDDEPKADVWYNKSMILDDKLIYHPEWEGKYSDE